MALLICLKGMLIKIHSLLNLGELARHCLTIAPSRAGHLVNIVLDAVLFKAQITDCSSSFIIIPDS